MILTYLEWMASLPWSKGARLFFYDVERWLVHQRLTTQIAE